MIAETRGPDAGRKTFSPAARLLGLAAGAGLSYALLFVANAACYKLGFRLPMPLVLKEVLTSLDYFDYTTHPQYRRWLKGFVMEPGKPWEYDFRGDTFRAFDIPETPVHFSLPVDAMGFVNDKPVSQADVLFLGDSFVRSAGCALSETIPSQFEALSGRKAYGAGQSGFGFLHYGELLRYLTETAPEGERFRGRDVFVMVYVGNDLKGDMPRFRERARDERSRPWGHYVRLKTLVQLARLARWQAATLVRALRRLPPEPFVNGNIDLETVTYRKRDASPALGPEGSANYRGFYPVHLPLDSYRDAPFAFNTYIRQFKTLDWLDAEMKKDIDGVLAEERRLADKAGVTLRFAIVPTNVQALSPFMPPFPSPPRSEFEAAFPAAARNFDVLSDYLKDRIQAHGFEVVDLLGPLRDGIKRERLYWPGDTHFTPAGNRLAARTLASADPETRRRR